MFAVPAVIADEQERFATPGFDTVRFQAGGAARRGRRGSVAQARRRCGAMGDTGAGQIVNTVPFEGPRAAAEVAADLLRRPAVARRAVTDPGARDAVDITRVDNSRRIGEDLGAWFPA